jgi:hypothetical protein
MGGLACRVVRHARQDDPGPDAPSTAGDARLALAKGGTMKRLASIAAGMLAMLVSAAGLAAQGSTAAADADLLLRVQGPIRIAAGDVASTVVVIGHEAAVDGTVRRDLIVVNGTARVGGTVDGNVTVINGHLELIPGARIGQKAVLYRSTVTRAPGAVVLGGVQEESGISFARAAWFFWFGFTLLVIAAGLVYAFLASRSLEAASRLMRRQPGYTALAALVAVVGLPTLAILLIMTGIGIPLGIAMIVFVLPALAFLGYVVAGSSVGHLALRPWPERSANVYLAVAVGLLLLQIVALVPGIGGVVALLASQLGAGALLYRVWRRKRGRSALVAVRVAPLQPV